jgi:hypothetical protein
MYSNHNPDNRVSLTSKQRKKQLAKLPVFAWVIIPMQAAGT